MTKSLTQSKKMTAKQIRNLLKDLADPGIAAHSQRFFKTGKGEYGEGDRFLGIRVPVLRKRVRKFQNLALKEARRLLKSEFHEERLFALLLLVHQFNKGDEAEKKAIYKLYLDHTGYINNWDLVDSSAHHIVGNYLEDKDRKILYKLSKSSRLWERRIAIMATFYFIKKNQFDDALAISELLIDDKEDLIHKAVGWMLREIGNRDLAIEKAFLEIHYQKMPRTMLRYAIEKFPDRDRKKYLQGIV